MADKIEAHMTAFDPVVKVKLNKISSKSINSSALNYLEMIYDSIWEQGKKTEFGIQDTITNPPNLERAPQTEEEIAEDNKKMPPKKEEKPHTEPSETDELDEPLTDEEATSTDEIMKKRFPNLYHGQDDSFLDTL
jgi:hypothetical protein